MYEWRKRRENNGGKRTDGENIVFSVIFFVTIAVPWL